MSELVVEGMRLVRGGRAVLEGASFRARAGEILAVVGPNGAGKTTLLRVAAGLLSADSGRVHWDGRDVASASSRERARMVAFVPQEVHFAWPFSVRDVVAMGRYAHHGAGADGKRDAEVVAAALVATSLDALAERSVDTLSSGERRRVLLARALAQDASAFLLDEPLANLDLAQSAAVLETIDSARRRGKAIVVVEHDVEEAARVADRIVLMSNGRGVADGSPREVLTSDLLQGVYGVPVSVDWDPGGDRVHVRAVP